MAERGSNQGWRGVIMGGRKRMKKEREQRKEEIVKRTEERGKRKEERRKRKEEGRTFWHTCPNGPRPFRSKSGTAKRSSFDSAQNSPEAGTADMGLHVFIGVHVCS